MDTSQLTQIFIFIVILVVAWVVLRFVLRLAWKIFSIGCSLIVLLGIILVAMRLIQGS
jgi:hypothetical protein